MVSPRRSSRARSTANAVTGSHSSSSSSRSRHTRHRTEDADLDASYSRDIDMDGTNDSRRSAAMAEEAVDDAADGEDEITRCVCGYQEYQGGDDDQADTDGLFIQCDTCSVWQHGFCVGITDSASTPENYYCEKCKPELHQEGHSKSGMKTSIYLPAQEENLKPHSKDNQKRRTTMNSRDAEYDDEVFQRMLELSKQEQKKSESTRGSRGRKRGSSEGSDDSKDSSKRARTSHSPDSSNNVAVESSDERTTKGSAPPGSAKKSRNGNSRNNNVSSNPPVEPKRSSARNRNGVKSDSKKDDSEHSDDYNPRKNNRTNGRSAPEEPAANTTPVAETVSEPPQQPPKRSNRTSTHNNTRRNRNNARHVRQSEDPNDGSTAMERTGSSTGHHHKNDAAAVMEKPTKPRLPAARMTLNEMKRRVNGISEYITRTQIEMATSSRSDIYAYMAWMEEKGTPISKTSPSSTPRQTSTPTPPTSHPAQQLLVNGTGATPAANEKALLEKSVDALTSQTCALDIMEMLSTKINRWQQHYGEKV